MRSLIALISAGVVLLATAPAASADLDFTPNPTPFQSEVGELSLPQIFRVSARCSQMWGICTGPDTVTVAPSITPVQGGDFAVTYNTCPPTLTSGVPDPHPSCHFTVRFTPFAVGTSTATLNVGSGSNGQVSRSLIGTGTPSTRGSTQGAAAKKRKCRKRKHHASSSARKCRHKRKSS